MDAVARVGTHPIASSQSARKEWRAVSEPSARSSGTEDLERGKVGQSEERTIYEVRQGTEPLDVDFCSITIDSGSNNDDNLLQQRLQGIARQREELQQMEIELRAQSIARVEIMEVKKNFDAQLEEHSDASTKLQEQLQERERCMHELEMKMEEKDRELRAIKIDNEAAWAKEGLLREQNKELCTFRRERGNFEAERAQHLKQIHDLKEHIREKESQLLELEEQHRVAQETVIYKDEQLREAQAWVARVQEMDALQSSTNHSLQAELQERTEQFNQIWLGCQTQFQEMERYHMQVIQQLQLELAEAREQRGIHTETSQTPHANSNDASTYAQNKGNRVNGNEGGMLVDANAILPNGNNDNPKSLASDGNASTKMDHVPGVPAFPSSILGTSVLLPPGQVAALHPLVIHQQGVPQSMLPTNISQPQAGHLQTLPAISPHQHWQSQQAVSENSQKSNQIHYQPSQNQQSLLRSDSHYDYEISADAQVFHSDHVKVHSDRGQGSASVLAISSEAQQVLETNNKLSSTSEGPKHNLQEGPSQLHDTFSFDPPEEKSELNKKQADDGFTRGVMDQLQEDQSLMNKQPPVADASPSTPNHQGSSVDATESNHVAVSLPEISVSAGRTSNSVAPGKSAGPTLLDERSLLACIVRAVPAGSGGRIRISTTLPNRLGKMLAPLHWHDYKKQYGKLDVFVTRHPELFVIEGDFIHLREGAQEIISATTAIAKVAAAAAAVSTPHSSPLPSVAVTPVAQPHRFKKVPTVDARHHTDAHKFSQLLVTQAPHSNVVSSNNGRDLSNVKILSKPNVAREANGFTSEVSRSNSSSQMTIGNDTNLERTGSSSSRRDASFGGKQQGRTPEAGLSSRR